MTISVTLMINNNFLACLYDIILYNGKLVHFIQKSVFTYLSLPTDKNSCETI